MHSMPDQSSKAPSAKRGVIYVVAGGRSYIGELVTSVKGVRKHNPELPITVYTDFSIPKRFGVACEPLEFADNPHKLKASSLRRSPYEETLFLDTDTEIRGSLTPLFEELKERDFCAANAHVADYSTRPPRFISMVKEGGYNTGVLLFRKSEATGKFLALWEAAVKAHDSSNMWAGHFGDQYFFNDLIKQGALEECGIRWGIVDNVKWNLRSIAIKAVVEQGRWPEVAILHQRTRAMKLRKLMYALSDKATVRVIVGKGWRALRSPFLKTKSC